MAALQAPGIDVLLLSRDRTVLFGPADVVNKQLSVGSSFAASRVTRAFSSERWSDGKDYFTVIVPTVGFTDLPSFGWSLLVRQNADDAMASIRELIRTFWFILGAGAVVALVLLLCAAQWLMIPLRRLSESAEAIVVDPGSHPPHQETRFEEAARLSDALAHMQSKLLGRFQP
ncbi:hypothetical protein HAP41_0000047875 (plasmid) [Bradyrhizobium barranii subsp. apii]|uniref:Uncharacterized protein n=1 Tax=Bradyrhizobium barranii subsp. apii TaxID=2819348 RepID=A0A8T5VNJ2_9BRAD|nr:hypothetical protein [Bradyrhizobium barranii]UPT92276.1 hypothetical protein HAP41_0000047875 [Bradyrhizobium barranii subsp. apii]